MNVISLRLFMLVCFLIVTQFAYAQDNNFYDTLQAYRTYVLAEKEYANGNLPVSNSYYKKSGALYKKAGKYDKWAYCEYTTAYNYVDLGEYSKAKEVAGKALMMSNGRVKLSFSSVAKLTKILGLVELREGDYQESMNYFKACIETLKATPQDPYLATLYNDLGTAYHHAGRREESLKYYKRSIALMNDSDPRAPHINNNIAVTYNEIGDYEQALKILRRAYELEEKHGSVNLNTGNIFNNIGVCYLKLQDTDRALTYFHRTVSLFSNASVVYNSTLAYAYNNIGVIYNTKKDYEKAWLYFNKSNNINVKMLPVNHPDFAAYYSNLATRHREERNYTAAVELYGKSLAIAMINDDIEQIVKALNNMALVQFKQGKPEEALLTTNSALFYFKTNRLTLEEMAITREIRALSFFLSNDSQHALEEINLAISTIVKDFKPRHVGDMPKISMFNISPLLIDLLAEKGSFFIGYQGYSTKIEKLCTSLASYELAISVYDKLQGAILADESKLEFSVDSKKIFADVIEVCVKLYEITKDTNYIEKAFSYGEKSRSILIRHFLGRQHALQFLNREDTLVTREIKIRSLTRYYQQQLLEKETINENDAVYFKSRLFTLNEEYDALMIKFANKYSRFYKLKYDNQTTSINQLQRSIDEDEVIVRFFFADNVMYSFIVTKTDQAIRINRDVNKIDASIEGTEGNER